MGFTIPLIEFVFTVPSSLGRADIYNDTKGINMSTKVRNGAIIALGAAALILAGCAANGSKAAGGGASKVSCLGINSCKGTSECKGAENACKGQNVCKGHGFLVVTTDECEAKHGTII